MKAGDKITKTLYMSVPYSGMGISITDYDTSGRGITYPRPCIGTFEVEITVPEFDPVALQVKMLENELARINADHHVATENIKSQIKNLLAIGHDGSEK